MNHSTIVTTLIALCVLSSSALFVACGDPDEGGPAAPEIVSVIPECVPSSDSEFDGDVLDQVEIEIVDSDNDISHVTLTISGAAFRLDEPVDDGDGTFTFTYLVPTDDNSILRCDPDTIISVRAVDLAGHVTEMEVTLL